MKRKAAIITGLALTAGTIYLCSQLMAQQGYPPAGQPRPTGAPPAGGPAPAGMSSPRLAVLNLGQVIRNYEKYKRAQLDVKALADKYQAEYERMKKDMAKCQTDAQQPAATQQAREQLEKRMRDLQRDIQDKGEEAKRELSKKEFDILVATYKEVRDAVTAYARGSNIDMVMHFNDGVKEDEFLPPIFSRKLSNGACFPMYVVPQMDITATITEMLNRKYNPQASTAPMGGMPTGGAPTGGAPINVPAIPPR